LADPGVGRRIVEAAFLERPGLNAVTGLKRDVADVLQDPGRAECKDRIDRRVGTGEWPKVAERLAGEHVPSMRVASCGSRAKTTGKEVTA
jgi:hypothetical protein